MFQYITVLLTFTPSVAAFCLLNVVKYMKALLMTAI